MDRIPVVALMLLFAALLLLPIANSVMGQGTSGGEWSDKERRLIASLSLQKLPTLPPDPSNHVADDPAAAKLGRALFLDTRLSSNGKVACATCHIADRQFQDDVARARGVGQTARRTMPIAGTAYSPFVFWDGRKDSQWSQALGPLESAVEHGGDRTALAHVLAATYREQYEGLFGPMPDLSHLPPHAAPAGTAETVAAWTAMGDQDHDTVNRIFANLGKAIEAYERGIMPGESRFDRYAASLASQTKPASAIMTPQEIAGLKIFIGKGSCINCHNGPLLTDNHFHNTGVPAVAGLPIDDGRTTGAMQVMADPFNCLGPYSDAKPNECAELKYMTASGPELVRAYKPPSLRNVVQRPPYMHAGQFETLDAVLNHYNRAPTAPAGSSELKPLELTKAEIEALKAYLGTLAEVAFPAK